MVKTKTLRVDGMTCVNCQKKIERKLRNTEGIKRAEVHYDKNAATVTYDTDVLVLSDIVAAIEKAGYQAALGGSNLLSLAGARRIVGLLIIIAALYFVMQHFGILNLLVPKRLADTNMGYAMIFVIGLITSVHCVAMCGGINLSQCLPTPEPVKNKNRSAAKERLISALRPAFLYNLGRVFSYTAVGFIIGALGSAISFSTGFQGALKLLAGVFMIVMGINMLGFFPWLRKINPRMPKFFTQKLGLRASNSKSPLIVGLLNGLMPCGPLQAMQLYALSTGNPFAGALAMLLFSLGTVPLVFGLGAASSILGGKFTRKAMTVGAVLVVVLGLSMFSQGWSLAGISSASPVSNIGTASETETETGSGAPEIKDGVQIIKSTLSPGSYPSITVQAGMPVRWVISAESGSINGCNYRAVIPEYNIQYDFEPGENVIEFTPEETGQFRYSCWMGMIRGTINVV